MMSLWLEHRRAALHHVILWLCLLAVWSPTRGMEVVSFVRDEVTHRVEGQALVSAVDGGVLLQSRDGAMWAVLGEEVVTRETNELPFEPYSRAELQIELRRELPVGFAFLETKHYLVAYDTSRVYAQWCAALFERLNRAFQNYWRKRGVELSKPTFPLVAVIFERREDYAEFSQGELGDNAGNIIGYYSLNSNRITTYDLTGLEAVRNGKRPRTAALINQVLSQPNAEPNVATMVHEATHQLAYNVGLQERYADNPLWLSEGLAVYFETPDLRSSKGWRGIGKVNWHRLTRFRDYLARRPPESLAALLTEDDRFRKSANAALDAYAEAWALCYFLIKRKQDKFVAYVAELSQQPRLKSVTTEERLAVFQKHFGDLNQLDTEFVTYLARVP